MRPPVAFIVTPLLVTLLGACGSRPSPDAPVDAFELSIRDLQVDEAVLQVRCLEALDRIEQSSRDSKTFEVDIGVCTDALAFAEEPALADLLRRLAPKDGAQRVALLLELTARTGAAADQAAAGEALLAASGPLDDERPFDARDVDAAWAGRGALRVAARGAAKDDPLHARIAALESLEFPLAERMAHRQELTDLYFGRWPADTIANRRMLGGFAIGWKDICTQWETGMTSVQYSRGLAALLAPVRAEVPGRLIGAVPAMGRRVRDAAAGAVEGHGAAGVISQGLLGWNDIKREFDAAVAVASASGRDAGIAVYQSVGNCRAPRALRLVDALLGAFDHYATHVPEPAAASPATAKEPS